MLTKSSSQQAKFMALDLGAGSGRAFLGTFRENEFEIEEIYRFPNKPVHLGGHLYWDFLFLWDGVLTALKKLSAADITHIEGIGVDSWNCDFGLIRSGTILLSNPFSYRDDTASIYMPELRKRLSNLDLYMETGIDLTSITGGVRLYQLQKLFRLDFTMDDFLYLPIADLVRYFLCGSFHTDETIVWGTQLADITRRNWHTGLLERFGFPRRYFPPVVKPGTRTGPLSSNICRLTGIEEAECIAVCGHDSASAAAAVPREKGRVFISVGTWSAVGVALDSPFLNAAAKDAGFVNEIGYESTLLIKNMMGFYLFEQLRSYWEIAGFDSRYQSMLTAAGHTAEFKAYLDPNAPELFSEVHPTAVYSLLGIKEQNSDCIAIVTRALLEGLAFNYRQAVATLEILLQRKFSIIQIIGGGSKNAMLCQMTANACGKPVSAGPAEATVGGNFAMQCLSRGAVDSVEEFWRIFHCDSTDRHYEPRDIEKWNSAYGVWQAAVKT